MPLTSTLDELQEVIQYEHEVDSNAFPAPALTMDAKSGPMKSEPVKTIIVSDNNVEVGSDVSVSSTGSVEAEHAGGKKSNLILEGEKLLAAGGSLLAAQIAAKVKNALAGGNKEASSKVPEKSVEGTGGTGEKRKSHLGDGKGDKEGALDGDKKEGKNGKGNGDGKASESKKETEVKDPFANQPGQLSNKDFVGLGAGSSEQQIADAKVQAAVSAFAGKKGSKVTISTTLTPEHWRTIFKSTGMYQGYAIDEEIPTQSLKSLFVNSSEDSAEQTTRPIPTKPCFLQMDTMSTSVDHANTQRRRYFVESGFRSADLSISVPYVAASVKADAKEKMAKEQETRTVFFTTKAEFPRCRIDIRSSVESGYLRINHDFLDEIREIWITLKELENALQDEKLDGKLDMVISHELNRRSKLAQSDLGDNSQALQDDEQQKKVARLQQDKARIEHDKARDKQRVEVQALRRSVVAPMRDLIKRYGALWVEEVTIGGQIFRTSKEEVHWDSAVSETAESIKADFKATAGAGVAAGVGAAVGSSKTEGNQALSGSNQVSLQAVGGDTLLYDGNNPAEWLDSVKDPDLWRIISLTKLRRLDELPSLENYGLAGDAFDRWSSDNSWIPSRGEAPQRDVVGMRHIVQHLLAIVAAVTEYEEHVRKVPRRQLGSAWVNTLKGHWYGCYTWHKSLSFPPRPCIMTVTIDEPEVGIFSSKTLGVESAYLHQLRLRGKGKDDKGSFKMTGVLQEVESNLRRVKDSAYEVLALVELRKSYETGTKGSYWKGSETLKYAAKRISKDERESRTGCLARLSGHNNLRADHNEGVVLNARVLDPTEELTKEEHESMARESIRMREGTWVYKGHLDRMGMHGYWAYESRSEVGQREQTIEQEGGTWTLAPIEELPTSEEVYKLPVFSSTELKKVSYNVASIIDPSWKPLFVSPTDNAADLMALLQPTGCPGHLESAQQCEKCAAVLVNKDECGLLLRKADTREPKFRRVLVAGRELAPTWDKSMELVGMKGMYLEIVPGWVAKAKMLRKMVDVGPRDQHKSRPLPSSDPETPWSFVQPENEVNEPRRRWLLPPDEVLPASKRVERPLGVDRFKGEWHGYILNTPLLHEPGNDRARSPDGGNVPSIVLPSPQRVQVTTCRTLGGTVGNLKYLVEAKTRPMSGRRLLTWKLRGTLIQLPLAEPLTGPAEHTYPILGEIDLTGTAHFLGVRIPFMRRHFYKGHLDYLGMQGFHGQYGAAHLRGTFGFMPVRDVEEKPDTNANGAVSNYGNTRAAAGGPRGPKCWPFRKTATPV